MSVAIALYSKTEIDQSGIFLLLQDQKLLQNQKHNLLLDTGAPVGIGAPVVTRAHVSLYQVLFCHQ